MIFRSHAFEAYVYAIPPLRQLERLYQVYCYEKRREAKEDIMDIDVRYTNVLRSWYICDSMPRPPSKRKTLTDFVLLALEKAVDGSVRLEDLVSHSYIYARGYDRPLKKSVLAQALKRLREGGLVDLIDDQQLIYRLTDSGRDRALWKKMIEGDAKWDGKWRLVVWDIPEKRRLARDLLRFKLKQLGFTQWQKSIWASKVNSTDLLRKFIKQVGIDDWVMVIESDNVGL